jgi:hypothetical protein
VIEAARHEFNVTFSPSDLHTANGRERNLFDWHVRPIVDLLVCVCAFRTIATNHTTDEQSEQIYECLASGAPLKIVRRATLPLE